MNIQKPQQFYKYRLPAASELRISTTKEFQWVCFVFLRVIDVGGFISPLEKVWSFKRTFHFEVWVCRGVLVYDCGEKAARLTFDVFGDGDECTSWICIGENPILKRNTY